MTEPPDPSGDKRALRTRMRARLAGLPGAAFEAAGAAVADRLVAHAADVAPGAPVALFASRDGEIDTGPLDAALRARGIARLAPRIDGDALMFHVIPPELALRALAPDRFGIPTPEAAWPSEGLARCFVVVPGLAFDVRGGRLGYGRGFYDRALAGAALERCVGLCLDEQIVDEVPMDARDVRLRALATPARGVFRTTG